MISSVIQQKYIPKRSPIFWGLIALVLISITPHMLSMLGASFQLFVIFLGDLIKGEYQPLGLLPLYTIALFATLGAALLFAAMLCLIIKKYRAASKLIIAGPTCVIIASITSVIYMHILGETVFAEMSFDQLPHYILAMQKLLILTILFLYAKKYQVRDANALAAT